MMEVNVGASVTGGISVDMQPTSCGSEYQRHLQSKASCRYVTCHSVSATRMAYDIVGDREAMSIFTMQGKT